jgi:benzoyl-CoA reductase/2-hydroxyglutaryl-CoA dehydratase subunit BcrC/BadD/HgdB
MNSEVRKRLKLKQKQRTYLIEMNLITEHWSIVELQEEEFKVVSSCT